MTPVDNHSNQYWHHFNHAGASPSPTSVLERVNRHTELEQKIGGYSAAEAVSHEINAIYQNIATLIHADSEHEIAILESATVAWTRAFYAMAEKQLRDDPARNVIIISDAEYAANVVAACQWARTHKWTVLSIPSSTMLAQDGDEVIDTSSGMVDPKVLQQMLAGNYDYTTPEDGLMTRLDPTRIALVCITQVPTNSGIVNPVDEIGSQISTHNSQNKDLGQLFYLVDACQAVGQLDVNVQDIQCHALVATGRKYLRGPRGTGFLYIASTILDTLMPSHVDHFGSPVKRVPPLYQDGFAIQNILDYTPRSDARRFEFWESSAAGRLGLGVAIMHALEISLIKIEEDCTALSSQLRRELKLIPNVYIHHAHSSTCGIVTFYSTTVDSQTVKKKMQAACFELSIVPATSTPIDSAKMGIPDLVRASISYTNSRAEISQFTKHLASVLQAENAVSTQQR